MLGVGLCIDCHSIRYQFFFISFLYKSVLYGILGDRMKLNLTDDDYSIFYSYLGF